MKKKLEEIPILKQKVAEISEELTAVRQSMKTAPSKNQSAKRSYTRAVAGKSGSSKIHKSNTANVSTIPTTETSNTAGLPVLVFVK